MPNEAALVYLTLRYLNGLRGCKAVKFHGSEYTEAGTPDIVGCYRGRTFLIEAKVEGGKVSKIQDYRLKQWKSAGAVVAVVTTLDEVKQLVKEMET